MVLFILKRLGGSLLVLFLIMTATFFLVRLAPGGPFDADKKIPAEILKNIQAIYHMDEPLYQQYWRYISDLACGNLGPSFRYAGRSVVSLIAAAAPVSLALGATGLVFALVIGLGLGLLAAAKPGSLTDHLTTFGSLLGVCLPSFVLGPLLALVFAVHLGWFHANGVKSPQDLLLPGIALGTMYAAYIARLSRAGLMTMTGQDFVRTAAAKGLPPWLILVRHCLPGGLVPVLSFLGPAAAGLLTGSFVVESIFNIPGLGRFFIQAALNRDYTLLMGMVLFFSVILLLMNFLVDVGYALLDPRIRVD